MMRCTRAAEALESKQEPLEPLDVSITTKINAWVTCKPQERDSLFLSFSHTPIADTVSSVARERVYIRVLRETRVLSLRAPSLSSAPAYVPVASLLALETEKR